MSPLFICDTPGLREALAVAYRRPPNYEAPVRTVPDSGVTLFLLIAALVAILCFAKKFNS